MTHPVYGTGPYDWQDEGVPLLRIVKNYPVLRHPDELDDCPHTFTVSLCQRCLRPAEER